MSIHPYFNVISRNVHVRPPPTTTSCVKHLSFCDSGSMAGSVWPDLRPRRLNKTVQHGSTVRVLHDPYVRREPVDRRGPHHLLNPESPSCSPWGAGRSRPPGADVLMDRRTDLVSSTGRRLCVGPASADAGPTQSRRPAARSWSGLADKDQLILVNPELVAAAPDGRIHGG